jgi:hypothetical protein
MERSGRTPLPFAFRSLLGLFPAEGNPPGSIENRLKASYPELTARPLKKCGRWRQACGTEVFDLFAERGLCQK